MKLIEKNIPEGWKVHVRHQHLDNGMLDATIATLTDEDGEFRGAGRALVNHRKEKSPSRKMGRHIAVGRAMSDALRRTRTQLHLPVDTDDEVVYTTKYVDPPEFEDTPVNELLEELGVDLVVVD